VSVPPLQRWDGSKDARAGCDTDEVPTIRRVVRIDFTSTATSLTSPLTSMWIAITNLLSFGSRRWFWRATWVSVR
jgi:hypothetical protein